MKWTHPFSRRSSRDDTPLLCESLPLFTLFQLAEKNETEESGVLSLPLNSLPLQKEIIVEEVSAVNLLKEIFPKWTYYCPARNEVTKWTKSLCKIVQLLIENVKKKTVIFTFKEEGVNNNYNNNRKIFAKQHPKIRIKWFRGTKMTVICTCIPKFLFGHWGNSRMASFKKYNPEYDLNSDLNLFNIYI